MIVDVNTYNQIFSTIRRSFKITHNIDIDYNLLNKVYSKTILDSVKIWTGILHDPVLLLNNWSKSMKDLTDNKRYLNKSEIAIKYSDQKKRRRLLKPGSILIHKYSSSYIYRVIEDIDDKLITLYDGRIYSKVLTSLSLLNEYVISDINPNSIIAFNPVKNN